MAGHPPDGKCTFGRRRERTWWRDVSAPNHQPLCLMRRWISLSHFDANIICGPFPCSEIGQTVQNLKYRMRGGKHVCDNGRSLGLDAQIDPHVCHGSVDFRGNGCIFLLLSNINPRSHFAEHACFIPQALMCSTAKFLDYIRI